MTYLYALMSILAAGLGHWLLWRLGRRLPVLLARWRARGRPLGPADHLAWQGPIELALALPKLALWLGAAALASDRIPALAALKGEGVGLLEMSFTRPLFTLKDRAFSALDLLLLPVALAALWLVVGLAVWFVRHRLLAATRLDAGARESLSSLVRYALLFVGGIVVLQLWGLDAGSLAVLGSVLGIGLGFGLQNIVNNFVSGLILGLERPIKAGDFVEVGKFVGTVERIGARSTLVVTQDRVSILVPNAKFLETEVINWSHGDPVARLRIPTHVAYGTSMAKAKAVLLELAGRHPEVLADPEPEVQLASFGDSCLGLELLVWTRNPRNQSTLRSDLNFAIEAAFRKQGIEIPFPQRELHLRSRSRAREREAAPELEEPSFEPRRWSDEELAALALRMRGAGGVAIEDRRYRLNLYPRCFVGSEAVDWLERSEGLSRKEAVRLGCRMVERGLFHHVLDEHTFADANYFYRFRADEGEPG